jgi:hypothetical protein
VSVSRRQDVVAGGFAEDESVALPGKIRAGFTGVGLHSLRYCHGSQLFAAGVPLPTVSKRLCHASPEITARIYAHSFKKQEREAADIWEGLLKENARNMSGQQLATFPPQLTENMAALTGFEPVSKP